jgi:hypothetical protein
MEDWINSLPWHFATRALTYVLRLLVQGAYQIGKQLIWPPKYIHRTLVDAVSISDVTLIVEKITGSESRAPKGLSAAEELFWWYWIIRLS